MITDKERQAMVDAIAKEIREEIDRDVIYRLRDIIDEAAVSRYKKEKRNKIFIKLAHKSVLTNREEKHLIRLFSEFI